MPSIITTVPDADFSGLGLGLADTPFSVRPFAGYVLGAKHVAGTDYTNLNDFCGSQGDLTPSGSHTAGVYDEALGSTSYYDTPFTLAQLFAAGSGAASMVFVGQPSLNACFLGGFPASAGAQFSSSAILATSPAMSAIGQLRDDAANAVSFNLTVPGTDGSAQRSMFAHSATASSLRGYVQNANGSATAAASAKTAGTYTAASKMRVGWTVGVGSYPGPVNIGLALFFAGDQYAYFPTLYSEIKAWFNEHGLGL